MSSQSKKVKKEEKKVTKAIIQAATIAAKSKKKTKPKAQAPHPRLNIMEKVSGSGDYKAESSIGKFVQKWGGQASDVISSIFGFGDYHDNIKYNTLMNAGGPPQFSQDPRSRSNVIRHREFIGSVTGTTNFTITEYIISPVNQKLCPWLSNLASAYEQYRIHGAIFEYNTTSGSVAATTAIGSVMLATQYNVNDVSFGSKLEMENYEYATDAASNQSFFHGLECAPNEVVAPIKFMDSAVRTGAVQDLRESQFGRLTVATVGQPATTEVGEIWLSYEIELLKPRLGIPAAVSSVLFTDSTGGEAGGVAFTAALAPNANYQDLTVAARSVFGAYTAAINAVGAASIITFTDPRLSGRCANFFLELDYTSACTGAASVIQVIGGNTTVVTSTSIGSNATVVAALSCIRFAVGPGPWVVSCIAPGTSGGGQVCRLFVGLTDHV